MKVTFLIPPVLDATNNVDRCFGCNYGVYFLPLLPVLYAATLLKGEAESIKIVDFAASKKMRKILESLSRRIIQMSMFFTQFSFLSKPT